MVPTTRNLTAPPTPVVWDEWTLIFSTSALLYDNVKSDCVITGHSHIEQQYWHDNINSGDDWHQVYGMKNIPMYTHTLGLGLRTKFAAEIIVSWETLSNMGANWMQAVLLEFTSVHGC